MTWFRYARHEDVPLWQALGWAVVSDLGPTHGQWSCLMQFMGEGEPE